MSTAVVLPALGESVTEGTVTRWLKNVGDRVEVDEGIVEISTDKVDTEIPSPVAGILEEILVAEDETVEVGALLARIGDGSPSPEPSGEVGAAASSDSGATAPAALRRTAPATPVPTAQASDPELVTTPAPTPDAPSTATASADAGALRDVRLPELGESVTEGTVTRWLKNVGDAVAVDDPLLEISTDKVDTEIPSPFAGVLREILVAEDETVEIGATLGRIGDDSPASQTAPEAPSTDKPVAVEELSLIHI